MTLFLLEENFQIIISLDTFTSLQWNARYYGIGDFELHIPIGHPATAEEKIKHQELLNSLKKTEYVYLQGDKHTGIIQNREYINNDYCVKGQFLESLFNSRVVDTKFTAANTTVEQIARRIVDEFIINPADPARKISNIHLGEYKKLGNLISYSQRGKHVDEVLGELLFTEELSYNLHYDFEQDKIYFDVFEGVDRTQSQDVNSWAVFSREFMNIISDTEKHTHSSNYKNFAYVAGMGEGEQRVMITVNQAKDGEDIKELWVEARDLQRAEGQSETDYHNQLITRGEQKLSEYQQIESVFFDVDTTVAGQYEIGDKCTYINTNIGIIAEGRITETKEVWERKGYKKSLVFGEGQLNIMQAVRRMI